MLIHTEDGETTQVDAGQVEMQDEDPFLSQDEVDSIVSKRVSRAERTTRQDLKSDEDFLQSAMQEKFGVELKEDGTPKGSTNKDELKQLRQEKSKLEEKASRAEELEEKIQASRETDLENKLLMSADGVKEDLQDAFMRLAKDRFQYDEDEGRHVATDENGEVIFNGGEPAGAEHVVDQMRENRPSFFQSKSANAGPDVNPESGSSGGKKTWTEEEHAAADPVSMSESEYADWASAADEGRIQ